MRVMMMMVKPILQIDYGKQTSDRRPLNILILYASLSQLRALTERAFSISGFISNEQKAMLPINLEAVMYLKFNHKWDENTVQKVINDRSINDASLL